MPSLRNTLYWAIHSGMDRKMFRILSDIAEDPTTYFGNKYFRFEIAYLIAQGCITADYEKREFTVTEMGLDGVQYWKENSL